MIGNGKHTLDTVSGSHSGRKLWCKLLFVSMRRSQRASQREVKVAARYDKSQSRSWPTGLPGLLIGDRHVMLHPTALNSG